MGKKERGKESNDLGRSLDSVGHGYKFCVEGGMNKWVGDRLRENRTDAYTFPVENENGGNSSMSKRISTWIIYIHQSV